MSATSVVAIVTAVAAALTVGVSLFSLQTARPETGPARRTAAMTPFLAGVARGLRGMPMAQLAGGRRRGTPRPHGRRVG